MRRDSGSNKAQACVTAGAVPVSRHALPVEVAQPGTVNQTFLTGG